MEMTLYSLCKIKTIVGEGLVDMRTAVSRDVWYVYILCDFTGAQLCFTSFEECPSRMFWEERREIACFKTLSSADTNVDDDEGDGWSTVAEFQVDTDDGPQPVPQAKAKDPAEAVKPSIPAEMPPTASPPLILGLGLGSLGATEVSSSDDDADDEVYKAWVESAMEKEMWAMKEELKEELRDDLYLEVEAVRETMETHLKNLPSRSFCARGDGAKHEFRLTDLKADLVKLQQTADISAPLKEMTSSIATLVDGFTTQETEARKKAVSEL